LATGNSPREHPEISETTRIAVIQKVPDRLNSLSPVPKVHRPCNALVLCDEAHGFAQ
jgi:hypothetical protein